MTKKNIDKSKKENSLELINQLMDDINKLIAPGKYNIFIIAVVSSIILNKCFQKVSEPSREKLFSLIMELINKNIEEIL